MDKTVVAELSATLAALRSAGETGFWILALFLLVVIALAAVAVFYQRIVISRLQAASKATEETFRSVDTQLKTIDTSLKERELGVKERDELRNIFYQQFSIVTDTNTELRTEMTRLREKQKGLKDSLNDTITAGLQDIRDRLTQTSVKEIIAQVPETFRNDLEAELSASLEAAFSRMNMHLREPDMHKYITEIGVRLCDEYEQMVRHYFANFGPTRVVPELAFRAVIDQTDNRDLAIQHTGARQGRADRHRQPQSSGHWCRAGFPERRLQGLAGRQNRGVLRQAPFCSSGLTATL